MNNILFSDHLLLAAIPTNLSDYFGLLLRLLIAIGSMFTIIQFIYARNSKRKDYYFSFFAVGVTVFLLSFLLNSVKMELGFALGLFAIFGIIRYRTDAIPIKEMTYMFVIIGVAVINALSNTNVSYLELLTTNSVIILCLAILEKTLLLRTEKVIEMTYEKIDNIHISNKAELLGDIRKRTGIYIHRYEIRSIDFLKDTAELNLFYYENKNGNGNNE